MHVWAWLRLMATLGMLGISVLLSRAGCGSTRNPASDPVPRANRLWTARHLAKVAEAKRRAGEVQLLFLGDSITQNYDRGLPDFPLEYRPIWEEFFAPHHAMNLGFDGDKTQNVLWRLRHHEADGLAPKDVVILIGTNNLMFVGSDSRVESAEQIVVGILAIVAEVHARMAAAHILVLSILPTNFGEDRTRKANAVNAQVELATHALPYTHYLDLAKLFLNGNDARPELFYEPQLFPWLPLLHPNPAGQRMMAQAVAKALYAR